MRDPYHKKRKRRKAIKVRNLKTSNRKILYRRMLRMARERESRMLFVITIGGGGGGDKSSRTMRWSGIIKRRRWR